MLPSDEEAEGSNMGDQGSGDEQVEEEEESEARTFVPESEALDVPEQGNSKEGVLVIDKEASQEDPQAFIDTCLPGVEVKISLIKCSLIFISLTFIGKSENI